MSIDAAREILAEALQKEPGDLSDETTIGSDGAWDSLAHTRLLLAMEARLGRELSSDEVAEIDSLRAVARILGDA
jgi:acyl carrier protein